MTLAKLNIAKFSKIVNDFGMLQRLILKICCLTQKVLEKYETGLYPENTLIFLERIN